MSLNNVDQQYKVLVQKILNTGTGKDDRTGTDTRSIFGHQMRFNLADGFPLITTKKVFFKGIKGELLWFLEGSTSAKHLRDKYGVTIWDEWERADGTLGPVYGKQWISWEKNLYNVNPYTKDINQIQNAIDLLKTDPDSRRIMVSAWNVGELDKMALQPCHVSFQFYTNKVNINDRCDHWCTSIGKSKYYAENLSHKQLDSLKAPSREISMHLYQRSADTALGIPFNIGSYALLLHMFANQLNMIPKELIMSFGDVHIYNDHIDLIQEQIKREPRPLPKIYLNPEVNSIFDYSMEDIKLIKYSAHPAIKMNVSV